MASQPANPPLDDKLLEEIHADAHTNTGIENKKLIMWLFLASDCMFFGTLISTHLIYRKLYKFGHPQEGAVDITGTFDIELTSFSTFILLMSSFLMALAVSAMHKGAIESFRRYTFGVIVFGLIFLGGQVYEFQHFYHGQGWYQWTAKANDGQVLFGNEQNKGLFHDVADAGHAKENFAHEHLALKLLSFEPAENADINGSAVPFNYQLEVPKDSGDPMIIDGTYLFNPLSPDSSKTTILSKLPELPAKKDAKKEEAKSEEGKDDSKEAANTETASDESKDEATAANEESAEESKESSEGSKQSAEEKVAENGQQENASAEEDAQENAGESGSEDVAQSEEKQDEAKAEEAHGHHESAPTLAAAPTSMEGMKAAAKDFFKHNNYGFQLDEFKQVKVVPGLSLSNSVFGSTFYVMTGTHGTHVAIGVLWLFSMLIYSYTGRLTARNAMDVEIAGLYWHFVDIVWIVIFTVVYLVEYIEL
ncbi:cytochrome c oxidase subunit 3 [Cerasicoccus fimbriatus]|uniref:cytochrome c oxidase subunit 3 n=1 Tax=Cerasicoccus fimbriatus TaxID=3014554 RepID=UPI0022B4DBB1|nr:cytochrome c oxidase subunit 3 [Cerasicoccus sp. TK19100]